MSASGCVSGIADSVGGCVGGGDGVLALSGVLVGSFSGEVGGVGVCGLLVEGWAGEVVLDCGGTLV